jgi:hypothetical protein
MKYHLVFCVIFFLLTACVAPPTPAATSAATISHPSPTATLTPTIVWFPPSETPTLYPTQVVTPTPNMRPDTGDILFEDDFSSKSGWSLTQTDEGSIAYGINELTIAIGETNAYFYSIREQPVFSDFYLEITTQPNLCTGLDEYGILIRVSSSIDYYRYALSCDGQVRHDRLIGGQASSPQPWIFSSEVPRGAPSSSRLSVSAAGTEMNFYLNGQYQFTVNDPLLSSGGLGVFARSVNEKAVTVNFSNLVVYELIP